MAVVVSEDSDLMDIAGAWEVFSDTMTNFKGGAWTPRDGKSDLVMPFKVYSVSDSLKPLSAGGANDHPQLRLCPRT